MRTSLRAGIWPIESCTGLGELCHALHDSCGRPRVEEYRAVPHAAGIAVAMSGAAMHDTSFDDTLLVPRLPPIDPPRALPSTFAQARGRHWRWVAVILAVLAIAAARPVNFQASQQAIERARQADELLPKLGR